MSDAHDDGSGGRAAASGGNPEGRGSGSSLTDAVVAALKAAPQQAAVNEPQSARDSSSSSDRSPSGKTDASSGTDDASAVSIPPDDGGVDGAVSRVSDVPIPEGIAVEYHGRTDVGRVREHNEDNFLVVDLSTERRGLPETNACVHTRLGDRGLVFAVCDGMGGAAFGEVASQMAVDTVHEVMQAGGPPRDRDQLARRLVHAVEEAGSRIFNAAKVDRNRRGMGTTATVAGMIDSTLFVGQVGDSRAYVLRGEQFALITKDQSLVNQLIEAGQLTEEEAEAFEHSNIILQALGTTEEVTVDLTFLELRRGDRLLMCSDGLSGLVHGDMIKDVLQKTRNLSDAAEQLIEMANAGGGHDNITIVLADFDGTGLREPSVEARVAYQQYPLPPEEPSDGTPESPRPLASRSTATKSGSEFAAFPSSSDGGVVSARLWFWAIALFFVVLIGLALWILVSDDGERAGAASDSAGVTITSTISATPRAAESSHRASDSVSGEGRIRVRTDVAAGVLFVNGEPHAGNIGGGMILALPAGAYRLELRDGETRVAEEVVTLAAGQEETVDLSMPSGEVPQASPASEVRSAASGTAASGTVPLRRSPSVPAEVPVPSPEPVGEGAAPGQIL